MNISQSQLNTGNNAEEKVNLDYFEPKQIGPFVIRHGGEHGVVITMGHTAITTGLKSVKEAEKKIGKTDWIFMIEVIADIVTKIHQRMIEEAEAKKGGTIDVEA